MLINCLCPPPRFSAQYRQYKYFIFQRHSIAGGTASLDIERMREAARHFVGEHDFRNFCKVRVTIELSSKTVRAALGLV